MLCKHCKTENQEFAKFCKNCGRTFQSGTNNIRTARKINLHFNGISTLRGMSWGLVISIVFLILLGSICNSGRTQAVFLERGWVPLLSTFLFMWALVILFDRRRKFNKEDKRRIFWEQTFPDAVDQSDIESMLQKSQGNNITDDRIQIAILKYKSDDTRQDILESLRDESAIDANLLTNSYMILKTIVWAIPVTGFIGTMVGMAQAIGHFSTLINTVGLEEMEAFKQGLANPLSSLSLAFDTTLLALILTAIIMFIMTAMHKAEENLLTQIDTFCSRKLVANLHFTKSRKH